MKPDIAIPILEKRSAHLAKRMDEAEATGRVLAFDRQEYLALQVAFDTLRKVAPVTTEGFVVTKAGMRFHRAECETITGRPTDPYHLGMTRKDFDSGQDVLVTPCWKCRPGDPSYHYQPGASASAPPPPPPPRSSPPPIIVHQLGPYQLSALQVTLFRELTAVGYKRLAAVHHPTWGAMSRRCRRSTTSRPSSSGPSRPRREHTTNQGDVMKIPLSAESIARSKRSVGDPRPIWVAFCTADCANPDIREGDEVFCFDDLFPGPLPEGESPLLYHRACWDEFRARTPGMDAMELAVLEGGTERLKKIIDEEPES